MNKGKRGFSMQLVDLPRNLSDVRKGVSNLNDDACFVL